MLLHLSTWPEVERYLERRTTIIIPMGSTEQHGPTGVIGTDCICPQAIAERAGERAGVLVTPTFNVGSAQHHLGFPGTITLRPETMIAAVRDWVDSLCRHGFDRLYFLNGHGGNIAPVQAAFAQIHAACSLEGAERDKPLTLFLRSWWELPGVVELRAELYGEREGSHATPAEIAVTHVVHEAAKRPTNGPLVPQLAPRGSALVDAAAYRRRFPDGRIGSDPTMANAEDGAKLLEAAVTAVIAEVDGL